jgi:peptidoglycan-N-acetylglucosamine deacetylase
MKTPIQGMYLVRPPFLYRWIFRKALFRIPGAKCCVFLTFDDGPHPEVTPFVLDVLKEENITATFFMLGKNAEKYPELVSRIQREGHVVANHGHDHLDGWRTGSAAYEENFLKAAPLLGTRLFRPPYGRLTSAQYNRLAAQTQVVMWDIISGDFDPSVTPEKCVRNVVRNLRDGSIIVMHDSQKAGEKLRSSLKGLITSTKALGYTFKNL